MFEKYKKEWTPSSLHSSQTISETFLVNRSTFFSLFKEEELTALSMAGSSGGRWRFRGNCEQHLKDSADSNNSTTSSSSPLWPMSAPFSGQYHPFMGFQQQCPANNSQAQAHFLGQRPRLPASQSFAPSPWTCRLLPIGHPSRPSTIAAAPLAGRVSNLSKRKQKRRTRDQYRA